MIEVRLRPLAETDLMVSSEDVLRAADPQPTPVLHLRAGSKIPQLRTAGVNN